MPCRTVPKVKALEASILCHRVRGAHRTRTSRAGRVRITVPVPVPFRGILNPLDGRRTGRSRPVHDRPVTAVTGHRDGRTGVSENFYIFPETVKHGNSET